MLSTTQKRQLEQELIHIIAQHPNGIDTRVLIGMVQNRRRVPMANRHHIAGMIAWVLRTTPYKLLVRTPGGPSSIA